MKDEDVTLSARFIRTILIYQPSSGLFRWRLQKGNRVKKLSHAGTRIGSGYISIKINGRAYLAHRLAFLLSYGYLPDEVDHINTVRDDNRIKNLREAGKPGNCQNQNIRKDNSSGVKGVSFHRGTGKWQAVINKDKKRYCIGYFSDIDKATAAVREARVKLHEEFARG